MTATGAAGWLVDSAGEDRDAAPIDVAERVRAGTFFWLDLEGPGEDRLLEFCRSLGLSAETVERVTHPIQRSSFASASDSVHAILPWTSGTGPMASLDTEYVNLLLGRDFLLTLHATPCRPLENARHRFGELDKDARADGPRLLFLAVDMLISSFKPQLLALDERLGKMQLDLLRGGSPEVHDELVSILGVLTDGIQELGWYADDLEDLAARTDVLPSMGPDAHAHFNRHRLRVARMIDNAREQRVEAKDALDHYSSTVAARQAQVINTLTIVATVFLPLSFLTGYFGMNFTVLTGRLQNKPWEFVVFGLLLPLTCVGLSLLLIRRLQRRFGVRRVAGPPE